MKGRDTTRIKELVSDLMRELGRKGGLAAARNMTAKQRSARARKARRAQLKAAKKGAQR
jgi:hypothetical protein